MDLFHWIKIYQFAGKIAGNGWWEWVNGSVKVTLPVFFGASLSQAIHHVHQFNMATENDPFVDDLPMKNFGNSHHCCNLDDFMILPWFCHDLPIILMGAMAKSPLIRRKTWKRLTQVCQDLAQVIPGVSGRAASSERIVWPVDLGQFLDKRRDLKRRPAMTPAYNLVVS